MAELNWKEKAIGECKHHEAELGCFESGDGVRFSLLHLPSNNRRGPFRLLIEVNDHSHKWGNFDESLRYYHELQSALTEAEAIAKVLTEYRWAKK